MSAEVGHLTDVKHTDDDLCFICIDSGAVRRVYSPSKPSTGGLWVKLLLVMFGLAVGAIWGFNVGLMLWL